MLINRCHPALSITNCQSSSPCHRTYHLRWPYEIRPEKSQKNGPNSKEKPAAPPFTPAFLHFSPCHSSINTTLAGVAQSVERVALITAKRSTSRSWVRAPPSAIPIIQAHQSSCSFAFLSGGGGGWSAAWLAFFGVWGSLLVVVAWQSLMTCLRQ